MKAAILIQARVVGNRSSIPFVCGAGACPFVSRGQRWHEAEIKNAQVPCH